MPGLSRHWYPLPSTSIPRTPFRFIPNFFVRDKKKRNITLFMGFLLIHARLLTSYLVRLYAISRHYAGQEHGTDNGTHHNLFVITSIRYSNVINEV